jgi:hypothetical protein
MIKHHLNHNCFHNALLNVVEILSQSFANNSDAKDCLFHGILKTPVAGTLLRGATSHWEMESNALSEGGLYWKYRNSYPLRTSSLWKNSALTTIESTMGSQSDILVLLPEHSRSLHQ